MKKSVYVLLGLIIVSLTCAQATDITNLVPGEPAGFIKGLIHGFIAPFAFVVGLFKNDIAIYAINNTGGWYDFGYLLGLSTIFGGGCGGAKRKKMS